MTELKEIEKRFEESIHSDIEEEETSKFNPWIVIFNKNFILLFFISLIRNSNFKLFFAGFKLIGLYYFPND